MSNRKEVRNTKDQIIGYIFTENHPKYGQVWKIENGNPKEGFRTDKDAILTLQQAKTRRMLDPDALAEIREG